MLNEVKQPKKSLYYIIPFIKSAKKYKLMHSDRKKKSVVVYGCGMEQTEKGYRGGPQYI